MGQQVQQEGVFASWRVLDQFDQFSSLLCGTGPEGMPRAARSATCWR